MNMKLFFVSLLFFVTTGLSAQDKIPATDKSPMDMSYCPANYPILKVQDKLTEPLVARLVYSRPAKDGRKIFGELIEYGKVWRAGANEATEIEFYQDVLISNVRVKKGRYTIYTIPFEDKWTFILNKETDTWGSFRYDSKKDLVRLDVPVSKQTTETEFFTMYFEKDNKEIKLQILWDDIKVTVPVSLP